jgi:hypothetical protein
MHRSGTSLVASLCESAGLAIGEWLVEPHTSNPLGHFEDIDFYRFHERVLSDNARIPAGYDPSDTAPFVSDLRRAEARALVAARRSGGRPWGWKDPRTILFLDFWLEMLPEAKYLFVFRYPWQVADSLARRGEAFFRDDGERAFRLWYRYNASIREFAERHADRVLVRSIDQFIASPDAVFADIRMRLGLPLADPRPLFRPEMFGTDGGPAVRGGPSPRGGPSLRGGPSRAIVSACEKLHETLQGLANAAVAASTTTATSPATPAAPRRRVAVVVPVPRLPLTPDEEISLSQLRHHLFAYDSFVIAPDSLDVDCLGMRVRRFPDACFASIASYNRLLLTSEFYDAFQDYDYILIYQLDCLVFSGDLDRWCDRDWDYAGAPWFEDFSAGPEGGPWKVGNGGLSLRRIEIFRELLRRPDVLAFLEEYQGQEDVFWSLEARNFEPSFRIPEPYEAIAFSIESSPRHCFELNGNALPFGCHYWNRIDRPFWEHFLAAGVRVSPTPHPSVLDNQRHPDHDWARDYADRMLHAVAVEQNEEKLLFLLTADLPREALDLPPTTEGVEQAFKRLLSQPAPAEWLVFWVGRPHLTLRLLYQDLIQSEHFRLLRERIAAG